MSNPHSISEWIFEAFVKGDATFAQYAKRNLPVEFAVELWRQLHLAGSRDDRTRIRNILMGRSMTEEIYEEVWRLELDHLYAGKEE